MVSRVPLKREDVDCIVFWTKNPAPMVCRLDALREYMYYFQFTLNPYDGDLELNLPQRNMRVDTFRQLADMIGPERVVWRYSPVVLGSKYSEGFHMDAFGQLAESLHGYTQRCMLSFLDMYPKIGRSMAKRDIVEPGRQSKIQLARSFAKSGKSTEIEVLCCTEQMDLSGYGVRDGKCIDGELVERITGGHFRFHKDKGQRPGCGCVESADIGAYDTCVHGCLYCYANCGIKTAQGKYAEYDAASPMLCGKLGTNDIIVERKLASHRLDTAQLKFPL